MPRVLSSAACATLLLLSGAALPALTVPASAQTGFRLGFDFFHNRLAPEGRWFRHPVWGDVWRPRPALVGADFQPYTNGYWELTDEYGWYWVSEDRIDDVVYHYGRWVYDPRWQWLWVPGYTWAPAWVLWREGDDYTGWMPLPPDEEFISGVGPGFGMRLGPIGLNFYRNWYGGRVDPDRFFVFVENRHLVQRDYRRFVVPRDRVKIVLGRTRPITKFEIVNNRVVNRGIDVRVIERAAGRRIAPVSARVVIKPNAVVTTVDEAKQIRVRERAAHPIDVKAARRGNGGQGDAGTAAEPADRSGPAGSNETGNGRMRNPGGETMTAPSAEQPGKARGQDNDATGGRMRNPSGESMTGPSTERSGSNGRMRNPSGESMSGPSTERSGRGGNRGDTTGASEGSGTGSDSGNMRSPESSGPGGTIRHRPGGTTAAPGAATGESGSTESTSPRQRNRNSGASGADSPTTGSTAPAEGHGAMNPRETRPSTESSAGSGSSDAEQKDKRKPKKKTPEEPAPPQ
ncbi:MAG: hypothetical protein JO056_07300 [Alphaproteobacteria bacterium]|nr:hypothetical protein [Alphaproteobacteria bacterium]